MRRRGRSRSSPRGHATFFDGIQFRSRLEARWAAFFRILDWDYTYEPPLSLSFYIPDFAIPFGVAECKPFLKLNDSSISAAQAKMVASGLKEALQDSAFLLGAKVFTDNLGRTIIGLSTTTPEYDPTIMVPFHLYRSDGYWLPCVGEKCHADTKTDIVNHSWASYSWREAGNRVQWKAPKGIRG